MKYFELRKAVFSIINKTDPHEAIKKLHLTNWCRAFLIFFKKFGEDCLPFFLDVLHDPECWTETDTMYNIQLNRRKVAKKMIEIKSWRGKSNPLDKIDRFRIACWCCLEENLCSLFENFKRQLKINTPTDVKNLVESLKTDTSSDQMTKYWIYLIGDCASMLRLNGRHIYEYGIHIALDIHDECVDKSVGYVEAVEFFWDKIKYLPEGILSTDRKLEIFMKTTLRATKLHCSNNPEILEFCVSQIKTSHYAELLRRDSAENHAFRTLNVLLFNHRFDLIKKIFDCLEAKYVSEAAYYNLLKMLILFDAEEQSKFYDDKTVELFIHIWMKEGFDRHRSSVFRIEMLCYDGTLLESLVKKNYMEPLWIILDQASYDQKESFHNTRQACNMRSILEQRGDKTSLYKLDACMFLYCTQDPKHS